MDQATADLYRDGLLSRHGLYGSHDKRQSGHVDLRPGHAIWGSGGPLRFLKQWPCTVDVGIWSRLTAFDRTVKDCKSQRLEFVGFGVLLMHAKNDTKPSPFYRRLPIRNPSLLPTPI
ncbi:hypothetical protein Cni_G27253 [Canna indica]|uniref:Uncharacterized protein n=1 Tax=Canna indica TaxID=4628 RepID=A0AAQ3L3I2_9LILI|nr:hypothetical protein Cni_G27253 [Canna indica]